MELTCEFVDDYDHLDDNVEYILENIISEEDQKKINVCEESKQLKELFNTILLNKCECIDGNQEQCSKCFHGGNYVLNEEYHELVLSDDSERISDLIYECSYMCTCNNTKCQNRLVQYGPRQFLKIVQSMKYLSKGLITTRGIPQGAFICEYAGELLTRQEAKKIIDENERDQKMNYVLFLKESCKTPPNSLSIDNEIITTIVNPSKKGNIGRYLNHSCDPNCKIISVRIDCPIPKIAFFSKRTIKAGEEICFNYNDGVDGDKMKKKVSCKIPCLCGSKNCIKYLASSEY